ncbi:MAG: hypothetical protein IJ189_12885, partial [Clostridia bacterium]|nr:hypothetical protein [Clostridia bacterium]
GSEYFSPHFPEQWFFCQRNCRQAIKLFMISRACALYVAQAFLIRRKAKDGKYVRFSPFSVDFSS